MKKIFALALAIVMMMAIALPVFADVDPADTGFSTETGTHKYGDATGAVAAPENTTIDGDNMIIKYGVNQEYLVTIPADVSFGFINPDTNLFEDARIVKAENIVISGNEYFTMSVTSANQWQMVDEAKDSEGNAISENVDYTATLDNPMDKKTVGVDDDATTVVYSNTNYAAAQKILVVEHAAGNKGWDQKASGQVEITFNTAGTAQEGVYIDTLTFTVDIVEGDPRS